MDLQLIVDPSTTLERRQAVWRLIYLCLKILSLNTLFKNLLLMLQL